MDTRRAYEPVICSAADYRYALGLRTALFSALERVSTTCSIVIVDVGLREPAELRQALCGHPRCVLCDIVQPPQRLVDESDCGRVGISRREIERYSRAAWMRLFLADLQPNLDRLIYLDADVLVRADVGELWRTNMQGAVIAAVRDFACPTFATGLPQAAEALAIPPETPYFNAGVLLMDLAAWRRDRMTQRALDYMRVHAEPRRFADQDVLNAILAGRVHELDPRWNVQATDRPTPSYRLTLNAKAVRGTKIAHFNAFKPWQAEGIRASPWSIAMHIEFARTASRYSGASKPKQLCAAVRWSALMAKRIGGALRRRL